MGLLAILQCSSGGSSGQNENKDAGPAGSTPIAVAQWAKTVVTSSHKSLFFSAIRDGAGNIYAVGYQNGSSTYDYGSGVTATGSVNNSFDPCAVIVKYSATGTPLWARTVSGTSLEGSQFTAAAVDSAGNIYAVGWQKGTQTYTYGAGVSATGVAGTGYQNSVIVKYNAAGVAQWARTIGGSSIFGNNGFLGVTVDASDNVYASGYHVGMGVTYSGLSTGMGGNAVVVKYSTAGTAQWAAAGNGYFYSIVADSSGNVYAAGSLLTTTPFNFGNGVSAQGVASENAVLVKFSSAGTPQWARTIVSGSNTSVFYSVAIDASNNLYATGYQYGNLAFTYGTGISITGPHITNNINLVKYDSAGNAIFARTLISGAAYTVFTGIAVDSSGNIYCSGQQYDTGTFNYGNGVTAKGNAAQNAILLKYNSSGVAQWARTPSGGSDAHFYTVALDTNEDPFVSGQQSNGTLTYGTGVSTTAAYALGSAILVKYFK
jgi:hypothetical protein